MKCQVIIPLTGQNKPLVLESEKPGTISLQFGDNRIECEAEELWDAIGRVTQHPPMDTAQIQYMPRRMIPRGIVGG